MTSMTVTIQSPVKSSKFQVLSSKLFVTFGTKCIAYGHISLRTWNLELKTLSDPSGKGTTTEKIPMTLKSSTTIEGWCKICLI